MCHQDKTQQCHIVICNHTEDISGQERIITLFDCEPIFNLKRGRNGAIKAKEQPFV